MYRAAVIADSSVSSCWTTEMASGLWALLYLHHSPGNRIRLFASVFCDPEPHPAVIGFAIPDIRSAICTWHVVAKKGTPCLPLHRSLLFRHDRRVTSSAPASCEILVCGSECHAHVDLQSDEAMLSAAAINTDLYRSSRPPSPTAVPEVSWCSPSSSNLLHSR